MSINVLKIFNFCEKQIHRDNVTAKSPEEYYKRALVILIIDTFISEMTHRFDKFNGKAAKLLILTLSILYVLKSLKKMLTLPQFWKGIEKI